MTDDRWLHERIERARLALGMSTRSLLRAMGKRGGGSRRLLREGRAIADVGKLLRILGLDVVDANNKRRHHYDA